MNAEKAGEILGRIFAFFDGAHLVSLCLSRPGRILCAIFLGITASFGYAPCELWPLTLGALTLLFLLLSALKTRSDVFFTVLAFFAGCGTVSLWWLNFVMEGFGGIPPVLSWLAVLLFALYLGCHYALFATLALVLSRKSTAAFTLLLLPAAFALADLTSGVLFTGFPWLQFGSVAVKGPYATFLPLAGMRGTSLLIGLTAGSLAIAARRRFVFLPVAGVIVIAGILGSSAQYTKDSKEISAALVQGNVPEEVRLDPAQASRSVAVYWSLSKDYFGKADLVIWPEAALPFYAESAGQLLADLAEVSRETGSTLLTGILRREGEERRNSLLALDPKAGSQAHDKRRLVPFGEFVPFEEVLRPLGRIFNIPMSDFKAPKEPPSPILAHGLKFIPAICYEAVFSEALTASDRDDAGAIIMVSNDQWFGPTRGPLEHLNLARVRALELQKPMLRCTGTGVTAFVGPDGKIASAAPKSREYVLSGKVTTREGRTPYSRAGIWPWAGGVLILLALGIICPRIKRDPKSLSSEKLVRP